MSTLHPFDLKERSIWVFGGADLDAKQLDSSQVVHRVMDGAETKGHSDLAAGCQVID
jgi:hypothetical protein